MVTELLLLPDLVSLLSCARRKVAPFGRIAPTKLTDAAHMAERCSHESVLLGQQGGRESGQHRAVTSWCERTRRSALSEFVCSGLLCSDAV